ncbi:hypothetical protein D3C76_1723920 [compost metagenome]
MTSLERRMNTRVPKANFRFLRSMSPMLFSVQFWTVTPASSTASTLASGVILPVRPTFQETDSRIVVVSSASNLKATAQRGNLSV